MRRICHEKDAAPPHDGMNVGILVKTEYLYLFMGSFMEFELSNVMEFYGV